jgi:hypothetical protein
MFALAAAIVAVLALFGIASFQFMLWFWLGFIALHFAFGWLWIPQPGTRRQP